MVYNWQLNSSGAAAFLTALIPYLRVKQLQARYAIAWFAVAQRPTRDERGRMIGYEKNRPIDVGTAELLKALKRGDALPAHLMLVAEELRG